jgi:phosphinothricin acetyltransferase
MNAATRAAGTDVRLSRREDLPRIVEISNWAIRHTAANFRTEPETLEDWVVRWDETHDMYPCFVGARGGEIAGFAMASPYKGR